MLTLEILRDFTNETLEGQLADEKVGGLLVFANLAKRDSSRPETMRLLHTTGGSLRRAKRNDELTRRGGKSQLDNSQ